MKKTLLAAILLGFSISASSQEPSAILGLGQVPCSEMLAREQSPEIDDAERFYYGVYAQGVFSAMNTMQMAMTGEPSYLGDFMDPVSTYHMVLIGCEQDTNWRFFNAIAFVRTAMDNAEE